MDGGDVLVWVEDDGIGISQEHMDRIFDRFYQVDSSSTRRHGGIGLGLHLVKAIVEGAGGDIAVQSEVGVGTRFTLHLPPSGSGGEEGPASKTTTSGRMASSAPR